MITVRLPRSQYEYQEACKLVSIVYQQRSYAEYLRPVDNRPDVLFVADDDGRIVGSVGIMLPDGEFPIDWFFDLTKKVALPISRGKQFEICKLACLGKSSGEAFKGLICAIYDFAISHQLELGLACMKPALARRLADIGLEHQVLDLQVISRRVPNIYKGYFLEDPKPITLTIPVDKNKHAVCKLREDGRSAFQVKIDSCLGNEGATNWFDNLVVSP